MESIDGTWVITEWPVLSYQSCAFDHAVPTTKVTKKMTFNHNVAHGYETNAELLRKLC